MNDSLQVRTVRLEMLRAGPPHNQLLSPLTPYLAVCGDSPAGVLHVPYEHTDFERRLQDLRYAGLSQDRLFNLRKTGVDIGRMLAAVPGLAGAVGAESETFSSLVHLRVTLSASELALLPYELAKVPTTIDGESEAWLALQTNPPVCITRHIRTVSLDGFTWPTEARILFIAGPPGDIPYLEHRRALEQAIESLRYPGDDDAREGVDRRHTHFGSLLTIIEDATLDDVVRACRSTPFTHVHVLAHGAVDESSKGQPFGIRLRRPSGDTDIVSGERFSTAIRRVDQSGIHRPFVVTLASCDSSNQKDVLAPGASFAHTLHQSGIPLVVGSQFPLTKTGSITVVERLYNGLLQGENPQVLLHQTRSELHARYGADNHDWASLVVYEALPANSHAELEQVRYRQGKLRLNAALQHVDLAVEAAESTSAASDYDELEERVTRAVDTLPMEGAYAIESRGLRASAMKRLAQAAYRFGLVVPDAADFFDRSCERLEDALTTYKLASEMFLRNDAAVIQRAATLHWVLVQQLSLNAVLRQPLDSERLAAASLAATLYLDHANLEERAWAHASLAEIALMRLAHAEAAAAETAARDVREHLERMIEVLPADKRFCVASTRKQLKRYIDWWEPQRFEQALEARLTSRREWMPWRTGNSVRATAEEGVKLLDRVVRRERRRTPRQVAAPAAVTAPAATVPPASVVPLTDATLSAPSRPRGRSRTAFIDIHMLPADHGDCLWIEYGRNRQRPSRVLIDCGTRRTSRALLDKVRSVPERERTAELFILTHIDDDHIGGAIPFLQAEMGGLAIDEVWFNAYEHLRDLLSAEQGEQFQTLIKARHIPWNRQQDGGRIVVTNDPLPEHELPGGMKLTLLSPTIDRLDKLRSRWEAELEAKGMTPGAGVNPDDLLGGGDPHANSTDLEAMAALPFTSDTAPNNGSSIAVLAEFEGKRVLFGADAHPPVLEAALARLLETRGQERLSLDAFKVSHHGSHGNTSPELLQLLDCRRYLISTNGNKFHHPHRVTMSRIITSTRGAELHFNYLVQGKNDVWADQELQSRHHFTAHYPEGTNGLQLTL